MLANFFSKSKPVNFLVLFLLFLCFYIAGLFSREITIGIIGKELFFFITLFSIYNFIILKNELTFDNSFAYFFYTILVLFFVRNISISTLFYANLTSLLFIRKVYSLQSTKNIFQKLFDGGLWLGISFIIEPMTIVFTPLVFASVFLHQQLTYKTIFTPILGFLSPIILYFTYCYWYDFTEHFFQLYHWWEVPFDFNLYKQAKYLFPVAFTGLFTLVSLFLKTPKTLAILNRFRKNWLLILLHLLLSGIVFILIPKKSGVEFLFLLFPTSVILANGIELFQKKWYTDVLMICFIIASVVTFIL
ncbi:DUF6427 family protein [Tenacibaculum sp. 190524A02b]|uniref:DUF6427 family protein n=1 Tax=Tenacibaculum vairaonense TaxID=3137860 RepID=UPI0031FB0F08